MQAGNYAEAIDLLIAEPKTGETEYLIGRARIRTGEIDQAYSNFKTSYNLSGDGRSAACYAYLLCIRTGGYRTAREWHEKARKAGFDSPEMQSNDAFCRRRTSDYREARRLVTEALRTKPTLDTAILNLAFIDLQDALASGRPIPSGIFDRALRSCPESYALYMAAAHAIAGSDMPKHDRDEQAIKLLTRALELGAIVNNVKVSYPTLQDNPAFHELVERKWNSTPVPPLFISDPLGELPPQPSPF
jgi:tetratricopeptide (TPR) repeat protein